MKNPAEAPTQSRLHGRRAAAALSLLLVAGATGYTIGSKDSSDNAPVTTFATKEVASRTAYTAVSAERLSKYYTREANSIMADGSFISDMQFLNGTITATNGDSAPIVFKNPILLAVNTGSGSESTVYDAAGAFLDGAYFGVASTDSDGNVRIGSIPFSSEDSTFTAFDPNNVVVSPSVYVQSGKEGAALYAYDVNAGQTMTNPDGSLFSPQLAVK